MFSELGGILTLTENGSNNLVKDCANMLPLLSYVTPSTNGKLCLLANQK